MKNTIDDFARELTCTYKGETYSVRDNGAVRRHPREDGRKRLLDDLWTFGKVDTQKGYLVIADAQVHRIVATAFHGQAPTEQHVIDHINTNKQDNRPENLRWVTRLENIILNPITCKKISYLTGKPIDYVLQHIEILHEVNLSPNFTWMRTVTKEESQNCYENLLRWAHQANVIPSERRGAIGEWIYQKRYFSKKNNPTFMDKFPETKQMEDNFHEVVPLYHIEIYPSLTPNAFVKGRMTPSYFPCCPEDISDKPLETYYDKLMPGSTYYENKTYKMIILDIALYNGKIIVKCESGDGEDAVKPWSVGTIIFENGVYIHSLYRTCFKRESADKYFTVLQDKEWTGGAVFDDYC